MLKAIIKINKNLFINPILLKVSKLVVGNKLYMADENFIFIWLKSKKYSMRFCGYIKLLLMNLEDETYLLWSGKLVHSIKNPLNKNGVNIIDAKIKYNFELNWSFLEIKNNKIIKVKKFEKSSIRLRGYSGVSQCEKLTPLSIFSSILI